MWVDGIQRIICGVTDKTTCQDVVIALAHATGKTGRFVLVERWRDNERLMSPADYPAQILSKWGEYAHEVQLVLRKSESQSRPPSVQNTPGTFLHDFSPPVYDSFRSKDSSIRKVSTFSGAHGNAGQVTTMPPGSSSQIQQNSFNGNRLEDFQPSGGRRGVMTQGHSLDIPDNGQYDLMLGDGQTLDVDKSLGRREQVFRRSLPKDVLKKWPHEASTDNRRYRNALYLYSRKLFPSSFAVLIRQ